MRSTRETIVIRRKRRIALSNVQLHSSTEGEDVPMIRITQNESSTLFRRSSHSIRVIPRPIAILGFYSATAAA